MPIVISKMPAPDSYTLEFDDSGAGWRVEVPAGRPASLALERGRQLHHAGPTE